MRKDIYIWSILCVFISISGGCLDDIDLKVPPEQQETIIVQGRLIKKQDHAHIEVQVTNLFDFTPESRRTIVLRSAEIFEKNGGKRSLEKTTLNTYTTRVELNDPTFPIEYGNEYWIRVETLEDQVFTSIPDMLFRVPKTDTIRFEYLPKEDNPFQINNNVKFFASGNILDNVDDKKSRIRFFKRKTFRVTDCLKQLCYVDNFTNLDNIVTLDGNTFPDYKYKDLEVFKDFVSFEYAQGNYFSLFAESLSDQAYQYWNESSSLFLRTGNMFEEPVGTHFTNIRNEDQEAMDNVFGFFYATQIDTFRLYVDSSLVGTPLLACPPLRKAPECLPCCNCLGMTGSSLEKPDFWIN